MATPNWKVQKDGKEHGPFDSATLKRLADAGKIKPYDLIQKVGADGWHRAETIKGLFAVASPAADAVPAKVQEKPAPVAASAVTAPALAKATKAAEKGNGQEESSTIGWGGIAMLFVVGGVLSVAGDFLKDSGNRGGGKSSAKAEAARVQEFVVEVQGKLLQIVQRATATPRIALGGPIAEMQALSGSAESIPEYEVTRAMSPYHQYTNYLRANLILLVRETTDGWMRVMAGDKVAGAGALERAGKYASQLNDALRSPSSIVPDVDL